MYYVNPKVINRIRPSQLCMNPLDTNKITITVEYELGTADEDIDEELIRSLLEDEPVTHVLSLIGNGTGLEWRKFRKGVDVSVEEVD